MSMSYASIAHSGSSPQLGSPPAADSKAVDSVASAPDMNGTAKSAEREAVENGNDSKSTGIKNSQSAQNSVQSVQNSENHTELENAQNTSNLNSSEESPVIALENLEKPKKSTLAPAPVPSKSAWSTTGNYAAIVDEQKWPTTEKLAEIQPSKGTKPATKFIKANKWVPIEAKVVLSNPRPNQSFGGQKQKRKSKSSRKKTDKKDSKDEDASGETETSTNSSIGELETADHSDKRQQSKNNKKYNGNGNRNLQVHRQGNNYYPIVNAQKPFRGAQYHNYRAIPFMGQPQPLLPGMAFVPVQIPPPISPTQNPQQALTQQIDYYFSLENLIRDVFLRKNMGTEGWVDLDLIMNFKRVEIIINGIRNSIEEKDEAVIAEVLDQAILHAVQLCQNLEIGYLNGKEDHNAKATEVQLRVKYNFEQWLLPDN